MDNSSIDQTKKIHQQFQDFTTKHSLITTNSLREYVERTTISQKRLIFVKNFHVKLKNILFIRKEIKKATSFYKFFLNNSRTLFGCLFL